MQIEIPDLQDDESLDELGASHGFARTFAHRHGNSGSSYPLATPSLERPEDYAFLRYGETSRPPMRYGLDSERSLRTLPGALTHNARSSEDGGYFGPAASMYQGSQDPSRVRDNFGGSSSPQRQQLRATAMQPTHSQASSSTSTGHREAGSTDHGHSSSSGTSYQASPNLSIHQADKTIPGKPQTRQQRSQHPQPMNRDESFSAPTHQAATSTSSTASDSLRSSSEYALHVLFSLFVRSAEAKIQNVVMNFPLDREPNLSSLLGKGADPAFDTVLENLALLAKTKTRAVIDSVMLWRKSKAEAVDMTAVRSGLFEGAHLEYQVDVKEAAAILNGRKSLVSIFILSRALIEIVQVCKAGSLPRELATKLEEIIFNQLRSADLDMITRSANRRANIDLFSELLGHLSALNFTGVAEKFVRELSDRAHVTSRDRQSRVELFLYSMRKLKIKVYPEDSFEQAAEFLRDVAKIFSQAHGTRLKYAYAEALIHLMLPVASTVTAEVNVPAWKQATELILTKAKDMLGKDRYTSVALPLVTTALCVSPPDTFMTNWSFVLEACVRLTKEKSTRNLGYTLILRMTWVYLYRCHESLSATSSRLDSILRHFWVSERKINKLQDVPMALPALLLQYISMRYHDYGTRVIFTTLLNEEAFAGSSISLTLDLISPERASIAITAFSLLLQDADAQRAKPDFPSKMPLDIVTCRDGEGSEDCLEAEIKQKFSPAPHLRETHSRICNLLGKILTICDHFFAGPAWSFLEGSNLVSSSPRSIQNNAARALAPGLQDTSITSDHGQWTCAYNAAQQPWFNLLKASFDALPSCTPSNLPNGRLIDMLCRCLSHLDARLAASARGALLRIAGTQDLVTSAVSATNSYLLALGDSDKSMNEDQEYLTNRLDAIVSVYIHLLQKFRAFLRNVARVNESPAMNSIWPILEDIEAIGLLYLCSQCQSLRSQALEILGISSDLHDEVAKSRRETGAVNEDCIIHKLKCCSQKILKAYHPMSVSHERHRLQVWIKSRDESALTELAVSTDRLDCILWRRLQPTFFAECALAFPTVIALAKTIVSRRLLHMYPSIREQSGSRQHHNGSGSASRLASKTICNARSGLMEWRSYAIFACTVITSTAENGSSSPTKSRARWNSGQNIDRTSGEHLLSASDVFSMLVPLLYSSVTDMREAVITSLSSANASTFRALLEELEPYVRREFDLDCDSSHGGSQISNANTETVRCGMIEVLTANARHLSESRWAQDQVVSNLMREYILSALRAAAHSRPHQEWRLQKSRRLVCDLVAAVIQTPGRVILQAYQDRPSLQAEIFATFGIWSDMELDERAARTKEAHLLAEAAEQHKGSHDRTLVIQAVRIEAQALRVSTVCAMAQLCRYSFSDHSDQTTSSIRESRLLWIKALWEHKDRENRLAARTALALLIDANMHDISIYSEVAEMCYAQESKMGREVSMFEILSDCALMNKGVLPGASLLPLALYKLGSSNSKARQCARKLLAALTLAGTGTPRTSQTLPSDLETSVVNSQAQCVQHLASTCVNLTDTIFTAYGSQIATMTGRHSIVAIELIDLLMMWASAAFHHPSFVLSPILLASVLLLTVHMPSACRSALSRIWASMAGDESDDRVAFIYDYFTALCVTKRRHVWSTLVAQVTQLLCTSSVRARVLRHLFERLSPTAMATANPDVRALDTISSTIESIIESTMESEVALISFSEGLSTFLFLKEVDLSEDLVLDFKRFALLLHVCINHLDHPAVKVKEDAGLMTCNLMQGLPNNPANLHDSSHLLGVIARLANFRDHDDRISLGSAETSSSEMLELVAAIAKYLSNTIPAILDEWSSLVLIWATTCPVRHLACRSFQILRGLKIASSIEGLSPIVARLAGTIADPSPDVQKYCLEAMMTIRYIVTLMTPESALKHPYLWWVLVACLCSPNDREYSEALSSLTLLLPLWKSNSQALVTLILGCAPTDGKSQHSICSLLLRGLCSGDLCETTLEVLTQVMEFSTIDRLDSSDTFLRDSILGGIPNFVQSWASTDETQSGRRFAGVLSAYAGLRGQQDLQKVLASIEKGRFRTKEDLIKTLQNCYAKIYLPSQSAFTLETLLGLLNNSQSCVKEGVLAFLPQLMQRIDLRSPSISDLGAEIMFPLLRLLSTSYATQVLTVLQEPINVSCTAKDRSVLRLSLLKLQKARLDPSATLLSAIGIPQESGWMIRDFAKESHYTRCAVSSIYRRVAATRPGDADAIQTLTFTEDHRGDLLDDSNEQTVKTTEVKEYSSSYGDIVSALDDLDQFFTTSSPQSAMDSFDLTEIRKDDFFTEITAPQHETKIASILRRSLGRHLVTQTETSPGQSDQPASPAFIHNGNGTASFDNQYNAAFAESDCVMLQTARHGRNGSLASSSEARMAEDEYSGDEAIEPSINVTSFEFRKSSIPADIDEDNVADAFNLDLTYDTSPSSSKGKGLRDANRSKSPAGTTRSQSPSSLFGSSPRRDRRVARSSRNLQVEPAYEVGGRHVSEGAPKTAHSSPGIFGALRRSSALSLHGADSQ